MNKIIYHLLIISLLGGLAVGANAQDQDKNNETRKQEKNNRDALIDMEIEDLQQQVNKVAPKFYQGKEKAEFMLARGLSNRMGNLNRRSFEERVSLEFASGSVTKITLYYTETNVKSLLTQSRTLINSNFAKGDLGDMQVISGVGRLEMIDTKYTLKNLATYRQRRKIKMIYRDYLSKLLKGIEYELYRRKRVERVKVDKILSLGDDR